jgi:hypothetical protein
MNTFTNVTRTNVLRRITAGALLAGAITVTAGGFAPTSHAEFGVPGPNMGNCQTDRWGFLGSQRRMLCDGPIQSDGSWSRQRTIWRPAYFTPQSCTYSRSWSSSCSGGYFVNEQLISSETYPVRPETVLHDEPGHLG